MRGQILIWETAIIAVGITLFVLASIARLEGMAAL